MKNLFLFLLSVVCFGQAQPVFRIVTCADAGVSDAYTCTSAPTVASYTNGMIVKLTVGTANTLGATLNIDTVGAADIVKLEGGVSTVLATNDLVPKGTYLLVYNSTDTNFKVISAVGTASGGGGSSANTRVTFRIGHRDSEASSNRIEWGATANATVTLIGTTPVTQTVLSLPDSEDNTLARTWVLPTNWTNTTFNAKLYWYAAVAGTNSARLTFEVGCSGSGQSPVSSFNTASAVTSASTGNALLNIATFTGVNTSNCAAGEFMWMRIGRVGADGADTLTSGILLLNLEIEYSTSGT